MNKDNFITVSYSFGWFSMIFGSLTLSDWAVIIGMFSTIFGFIVTWFYKHLEYKLKKNKQSNKMISKNLKNKLINVAALGVFSLTMVLIHHFEGIKYKPY